MSTPRYLDQDGLDGVLSEQKKSSSKLLVWIALLIITLLGVFFYSSREVIVDSSSSTPVIEKTQSAVNKKPAIDFKATVINNNELPSSIDLDQGITTVKDQLHPIHSDVLPSIEDKAKEQTGKVSNSNQIETVSLAGAIKTELSENINSSEKQIAEVEKIIDFAKAKVIAINRAYEYVFKFSSREMKFISGDETRRLTHFIEQCDNSVIIVGHTCNLG